MPRAFGYESHECLSAEVPQDWGKQQLRSWRATQCLVYTKSQGQSSAFLRAWARPSCWSWRVSWGRQGRLGLTVGTDTGGRSAGDSSSVRGGFLPRHDEDLREPLVRRQGSQVSMRVARVSQEAGEGWVFEARLVCSAYDHVTRDEAFRL